MGAFEDWIEGWIEAKKKAPRTPDEEYPKCPPSPKVRDLKTEDVIRLMRNAKPGDYGVGHELVEHGWPWKIVKRRLESMCDKGLIEYGVGLFTPWIKESAS